MRRFSIVLLLAVMAAVVGCSADTSATPSPTNSVAAAVRQLDPAQFAAELPHRMTVNVHVPDEGSLPDTDLALPYNRIADLQSQLPPDRATPIAIYCMTGHMSAIAGRTLTGLGYTDVVELRGGMQAWRAAGLLLVPAA